MKLTLDTDSRSLTLEDKGIVRNLPLYSSEAFELVSRQWVLIGWAMQYYFTFRWLGQPILQLPDDLLRLQETIVSVRPDVIVETGVHGGGSLLFHATLCEALGKGRKSIPEGASVMVIPDSDHTKAHVARELAAYAPMVTAGSRHITYWPDAWLWRKA